LEDGAKAAAEARRTVFTMVKIEHVAIEKIKKLQGAPDTTLAANNTLCRVDCEGS
jgi:hypothetical protein